MIPPDKRVTNLLVKVTKQNKGPRATKGHKMRYLPSERKQIENLEFHFRTNDHKLRSVGCLTHHDKIETLRKVWYTDTALSGVDIEEVIDNHLDLVKIHAFDYIIENGGVERVEKFAKLSHSLLFGAVRDLGMWCCVSRGYTK